MDRLAEKKLRLDQLVEYARKIKTSEDYKKRPYDIQWDLVRHARGTWLVSSPVARDYALTALELLKNGSK